MRKLLRFLVLRKIRQSKNPKIANIEQVLNGRIGVREYSRKYGANPAQISHWVQILKEILR
jgi:transposase-like protein